jgi:hypothetical protein
MGDAYGDAGREAAGRKLDHERGGSGQRGVRPAGRSARVGRKPPRPQPGKVGETALQPEVPRGEHDHVQVLVEPDRDRRVQPPDQSHGDPGLALRGGPGARVVDPAERPPPPREVAVQVDAPRVAPGAGGMAVRVRVGHEPEVDPCKRAELPEPVEDRDPRAFVAVDASHDEHLPRARRVAELVGDDRPALERAAEHDSVLAGARARRAGEQQREGEEGQEAHGHYVSSLPL